MQLICYDCGRDNPDDALLCLYCSGTTLTSNKARPIYAPPVVNVASNLPYPWNALPRWPASSVIAIDGGPGAGKSSLCALLRPRNWLTSEETVAQATEALRRLQQSEGEGWADAPEITAFSNLEGLQDALEDTYDGLSVIDSVTATGHAQVQLEAMGMIMDWARGGPNRRVVAILGHNQDGGAAGPKKIAHLAQIEAFVRPDNQGRRMIGLRKNRHGPLFSRYFELGANGVERPEFPYAYSVEGIPGSYSLVAYPSKKTEWAGRLEKLDKENSATMPLRTASAAKRAPYGRGFMEPRDVGARRAYALAHGLTWLDGTGRNASTGV